MVCPLLTRGSDRICEILGKKPLYRNNLRYRNKQKYVCIHSYLTSKSTYILRPQVRTSHPKSRGDWSPFLQMLLYRFKFLQIKPVSITRYRVKKFAKKRRQLSSDSRR